MVGWGRKKAADIMPRTKEDDFSDTQVIYEPLNIKLLTVRVGHVDNSPACALILLGR